MTSKGTTGINSILKVLGLLIIASVLLPSTRIVFSFKPDLPLLFVASILLIQERKVARFPIIVHLKVLSILLFISMLLSDNIGNLALGILNRPLVIPTEFMQVLSRVLVFYLFAYIAYFNIISSRLFKKAVSIVFFCALCWAMLQAADISIIKTISIRFYALTTLQANVLESAKTRIFGTAGNAITWGGLSALMFYFFFFLKREGSRLFRYLGMLMAVVSIIFCASRSALFAFILSFIIMQFVIPFYKQKGKALLFTLGKNLVITVVSVVLVSLSAFLFVPDRVMMILARVDNTEQDLTEEGRGGQLNYFIDLFSDNQWYYLIGIGKPTVDRLSFMEMEPFFLLFAYGIVGVILHYFMVVILTKNANKLRRHDLNAYFFIISTTIFYLVFSFGFFFFREVISGLPFWWLGGYLIGSLFKAKHEEQLSFQRLSQEGR